MLWVGLGILYFLLLVTLGIMSIRKGQTGSCSSSESSSRCFRLIGALMPPRGAAAASSGAY